MDNCNGEESELNWKNLPLIAKRALTTIALEQNFTAYKVNIEPGSKLGDGYLSVILRATIIGTKENSIKAAIHEFPVICKLQVASKQKREFASSSDIFKREVSFYNDYFPAIEKLQSDYNVSENDGFNSGPKCYYAEFDEDTDEAILVMKDIRDEGFKLVSKFEPADIEIVELVVRELGKLHAMSFALEKKHPEIFKEFKKYGDYHQNLLAKPHSQELWDAVFPIAIKSLHGKYPEIEAKLEKLHKNVKEDFINIVSSESSGKFSTIIHGDAWINNILFKFNPNGKVESLKFLDWQISKYASPVIDIAYIIFTATDKKLRDQHYTNLLKIYHESFSGLLKKFGENPDEIFSFDDLQRELKKFGRFGLYLSFCMINFVTISSDDIPDMAAAVDEFMSANKEVGKKGTMMKTVEANAERNEPRIRDVVLDMNELGYI